MPTLLLIRLSNNCSYFFTCKVNEIIRMLTQCALEGDLPAEAITQSALIISHVKETCRTTDQFAKRLIETEVSYLNLYEE